MEQQNTSGAADPQDTIRTAFTERFGVRYPILNAGMGWVAVPEIVAAVSNAGGLGVLGAGSMPPELARSHVRRIRELTDKPFGINCPLALPNARDNAKMALEEQVPVINYSMGKGEWLAEGVAKYGGKTIASVNSVKLAQSAQKQGADAVIAAGYEAAGHSGEIATFVLVPRLAELLNVPVIAAGGVTNGDALTAALALGASGVSMGTRFATSAESSWHDNWKKVALEKDVHDTDYSTKFDGFPNRMMRTAQSQRVVNSALNPLSAFFYSFKVAQELDIPYPKLLIDVLRKGPVEAVNMMRMAQMLKYNKFSFEGDLDRGMTASGQSVGLIHDNPGAEEIVRRVVAEARAAQARLNAAF